MPRSRPSRRRPVTPARVSRASPGGRGGVAGRARRSPVKRLKPAKPRTASRPRILNATSQAQVTATRDREGAFEASSPCADAQGENGKPPPPRPPGQTSLRGNCRRTPSLCLCASTRTRGPAPRGFTGFLDHVYSTLAPAPGPSLHKGRRKSGESARRSHPSLESESEQQSLGGRRRRVTHPSGPEARSGAWITCLAGDSASAEPKVDSLWRPIY